MFHELCRIPNVHAFSGLVGCIRTRTLTEPLSGRRSRKTLVFLLIDLLVVFSLLFDGKGPLSGRRGTFG